MACKVDAWPHGVTFPNLKDGDRQAEFREDGTNWLLGIQTDSTAPY
jgi:hypothetical protein